jgi:outer membrane protein OmpA-like peptidoglycan-associated protein
MRFLPNLALSASLAVAGTLLAVCNGQAQVSVDPNALDHLGASAAPVHKAPEHPRPAPRRAAPPAHTAEHAREAQHGGEAEHGREAAHGREAEHPPATAAAHPPAPPAIPTTPPPLVNLAPPQLVVPTRPVPPPPPVPVAADAPGAASNIPDGTRITFGADRSDLNPATVAAIRSFAQTAKAQPGAAINIAASAAGTADDPSTPRRMSLERALAARAVLINEGIPSTRIYVHANGTDAAGGPVDRADIVLTPITPGPPQTPAAQAAAEAPARAAAAAAAAPGISKSPATGTGP